MTSPKCAFIHGRPEPHPFHRRLGESVESDFYLVDPIMRWHDQERSKIYRLASMLACSLMFPKKGEYDVLISEGPHTTPQIIQKLAGFRKRPKTVALIANETLYFLKSGFYSKRVRDLLLRVIGNYDALICIGSFQTELAKELFGTSGPRIDRINSSISDDRIARLQKVSPALDAKEIILIADGPSGWRAWYKGIDILLDAIEMVVVEDPNVRLSVLGTWDKEYVEELLEVRPTIKPHVRFVGRTTEIESFFSASSLCVHIARGEAFGISVLESMCAGVPCIVSDLTGAMEAVEKVDASMVVPPNAKSVAERILWYLDKPLDEKVDYSRRSRRIAAEYTEMRALREFQVTVHDIVNQHQSISHDLP